MLAYALKYRPREGTAYGCIYSNLETPWGMTEGWDLTEGGNGSVGSFWRAYAGRGRVFDASQYHSGGSRGMRQWWGGWGEQQDRSNWCGQQGRTARGDP